jgi:hypothetical protein
MGITSLKTNTYTMYFNTYYVRL